MRREFAKQLYELMKKDENIFLLVGDLGYGMLDKIKEEFPDRFFNPGAAEITMMSMAVGMALKGKIPVVYSITPFLLYRPFEVIRNYINHENIPVILVSSGRDDEYQAGFSHNASDNKIMLNFTNIKFIEPDDKNFNLRKIIYSGKPTYLSLKR